jgi:hypothetical protein
MFGWYSAKAKTQDIGATLPLCAITSRVHYFPKEDIRSRPYYYVYYLGVFR